MVGLLPAAIALLDMRNFSRSFFSLGVALESGVPGMDGGVHAQDQDHARDAEGPSKSGLLSASVALTPSLTADQESRTLPYQQ